MQDAINLEGGMWDENISVGLGCTHFELWNSNQ